jgi:hypothetical protein
MKTLQTQKETLLFINVIFAKLKVTFHFVMFKISCPVLPNTLCHAVKLDLFVCIFPQR